MSLRYKGGVISATPPTTSTTSASGNWTLEQQMQAQGAGTWPFGGPFTYIEDVFSTWLYTGNGSTQTITNGIDLSGKGGLVFFKDRTNGGTAWSWVDTARGIYQTLESQNTGAQTSRTTGLTAFNTTGFNIGSYFDMNTSAVNYASWTFRKQPKFFDVVTYTGNGANRTISHNLGSIPGCIIVKKTNASANWQVYHRSLANTEYLVLNLTNAKATGLTRWNSTTPTATEFSLGVDTTVNANGDTYVAYLFAHDAGGFGLTGTDNVISCGSFTSTTAGTTVTLGYEPQYLMMKPSSSTGDWIIVDNMRGFNVTTDQSLYANTSDAEVSYDWASPTATGFIEKNNNNGVTYIYIAIRRGPMKTPTSGTDVFSPNAVSSSTNSWTTNFPVDMLWDGKRTAGTVYVGDRLRGNLPYLLTSSTAAEVSYSTSFYFDKTTGTMAQGLYGGALSGIMWNFRRAPGFFDVVCYTGNGTTPRSISHNLGVSPELVIVKTRNAAGEDWLVSASGLTNPSQYLIYLNLTSAQVNQGGDAIYNKTATTVTLDVANTNNQTYVMYLFATVAGVSKVGSYTGTGALQTVNCGFTSGARFVLIKRTDSTGDWYVYDSARGITSGNDPYLLMNSTAAEVTGTNYVDTATAGFQVTAAAPAGLNANGGTYIFLAIA